LSTSNTSRCTLEKHLVGWRISPRGPRRRLAHLVFYPENLFLLLLSTCSPSFLFRINLSAITFLTHTRSTSRSGISAPTLAHTNIESLEIDHGLYPTILNYTQVPKNPSINLTGRNPPCRYRHYTSCRTIQRRASIQQHMQPREVLLVGRRARVPQDASAGRPSRSCRM
jgi:hypothetical protein